MMELILICASGVGSALALMALVTALRARWPRPAGAALLVITGLALTIAFAVLTLFWLLAHHGRWKGIAAAATAGSLAPAVAFLVGAAAIVGLGRASSAPGLPPRAAAWNLGRLALVLAVAAAVLVTGVRNARLAAQQAHAVRRAELASLEQLFWPGVPLPLNAAPVYALAYEKLVPIDAVPGARPAFEAVWSGQGDASAPALAEWTRRNDAALALAVEGTQRPGYASIEDALWRSSPFGTGREGKIFRLEMQRVGHDPSTLEIQISRRRMGDLLQTRSLQRAFAGQLSLAVSDANALFALADHRNVSWMRALLGELRRAQGNRHRRS